MNHRTVFTRIGVILLACCALIVSARSQAGDRDSGQRRAASGGVIIPQQPAGAPLLGLTADQLDRFFVGQEQFNRTFEVEEGLGPVFNQRSCGLCHNNPVGGTGSITVTRAGLAGAKGGFDPLTELGGTLFQQEAISEECAEVIPEEANVVAFRVTNGMMGYGLVEAIPDADIQYWADYPPSGEVSGKANIVSAAEDELDHVGRFGWKADVPTILTFSAGASMNELGITNPLNPEDNDPNGINPPELADCDSVDDPEIGMEFIEQLTDFQRFLTAAPQTPKSGMTGEEIFVNIGCADCHIAAFMTPDDPELEDAIRNKEIRLYTDYLLHDIGLAADFIDGGGPFAGPREIKTAPLSGIHDRDPMWHDARVAAGTFVSRMKQAIACHCGFGSEARNSAKRFFNLSSGECPDSLTVPDTGFVCNPGGAEGGLTEAEQDALIAFLDSLGRREFDADGEGEVDGFDLADFIACSQIDSVITPDDPCAVHDIDQNGLVDGNDFASFLLAAGDQEDCNCNESGDFEDIWNGGSSDSNANGVPDECDEGVPPLCASQHTLIIKQGACPAPVNPNSNGVVPMVLVGEADFAAHTAVHDSLRLRVCGDPGAAGIAPLDGHIKVNDLNHPFDGDLQCGECACNADQSSDGISDLSMKFRTNDLLELGIGAGSGVVTVELSGELADGSSFVARDCLVIVPPGAGQSNLAVESNVFDTFVEIVPLDLNVDSDGFTGLTRSYVTGTHVAVTAPLLSNGRRFLRWSVDGVLQPFGVRAIEIMVGKNTSLQAFFERASRLVPERPTSEDGDLE